MIAKNFRIILLVLVIILILTGTSFAVRTFKVQEGDLIKITPTVVDLDNDAVNVSYSLPLDQNGEWQTNLDDAGEYKVNIIASDGKANSSEEVKLVVENKNQAPIFKENKVNGLELKEINLKEIISDPDNDLLIYTFSSPFDRNGKWTPSYNDAGNYLTKVTVSDGKFNLTKNIEIDIQNVNQAPIILKSFNNDKEIELKENQTLDFFVEVNDLDKDKLTFSWILDNNKTISSESSSKYYFNFDSAGEHKLKVSISDGVNPDVSKEWLINIENVNRAPNLNLLPLTVREDDVLSLDLPKTDQDDDSLRYSFSSPLDEKGEWQPNFEEAGTYVTNVTVSDGELESNTTLKIIVLNVDRAPVLRLPNQIVINEGEHLSLPLDITDPDNDDLVITFKNFPLNAGYEPLNKTLNWNASYDLIRRSGGIISNVLNALRLENYFLNKVLLPVSVTACGKEKCTSGTINFFIHNINRAPNLNSFENISFKEGAELTLKARAFDSDGDILRYYYSWPLGKTSGEWQTNLGDKGNYTAYVTATDGNLGTTQSVNIQVLKNNIPPEMYITNDNLIVNEGQEFMFEVKAEDQNKDPVQISLENIPIGASFNEGVFLWKPAYNVVMNKTDNWKNRLIQYSSYFNKKLNKDKKIFWLKFIASDGEDVVVHPVKISVKDFNQKPEIVAFYPNQSQINVGLGQTLNFMAAAVDADKDKLNYKWSFGLLQKGVEGSNSITRTFNSAGKKKVKLVVSDGFEDVEQEWVVNVIPGQKVVEVNELPAIPFTIGVYVVEREVFIER